MSVPRFWREIPQRYNLLASRCGACGRMDFPPRMVCPDCRRESVGKMENVRLSGRGTILEATKVHKPAPGYEHQVPYWVALVQTEEGPVLTGQVVDVADRPVKAGMHVRSVFRRIGSDGDAGVIYYGTKWRLHDPVAPQPSE
ncbi:MAG: Zn-ribbon domain-containing OB-fold protein [Thermoplasmatota archaeon]